MEGAKKFAASHMGYAKSSMMTEHPHETGEGTCPLCGHFLHLDKRGYCGREECSEKARARIREIVRENGGKNIPGLYYRFGDLELMCFGQLEKWEEPRQQKHPDMCQQGECTDWALPADYLCRHHRLAENRAEYIARRQAIGRNTRTGTDKRKKRAKPTKFRGNKIRGLENLKTK